MTPDTSREAAIQDLLFNMVHGRAIVYQMECEYGKISVTERNNRLNEAIAEARQALIRLMDGERVDELRQVKASKYAIYQDMTYTEPRFDYQTIQLPVKTIDNRIDELTTAQEKTA